MNQISHTRSFRLNRNIDEVFPLFSPEGEKKWVPGWNYKDLMGTTELVEDYVFLTDTHDHVSKEAIWLVKRYVPESHFIEFCKVEPEEKIGLITVKCTELDDASTEVTVTYKYLALSESGQKFIDSFNADSYKDFINNWKELLNKYFSKN